MQSLFGVRLPAGWTTSSESSFRGKVRFVQAPHGHILTARGVHESIIESAEEAREVIAHGVTVCPDGNECDWCSDTL